MISPNLTDLERVADLRLRIHGLVDLPQLSADELACIELVIHGLVRGREVYGELDVATDTRDMRIECCEELRDAMTYSAAALLRLRRGRTTTSRRDVAEPQPHVDQPIEQIDEIEPIPVPAKKKRTLDDESRVCALYDEGKNVAEMATEMSVSPAKIRRHLGDLGISKAGKRKAAPLMDHIGSAEAQACAYDLASDHIVNLASISSAEHVEEMSEALGRLEQAARKLKLRMMAAIGTQE